MNSNRVLVKNCFTVLQLLNSFLAVLSICVLGLGLCNDAHAANLTYTYDSLNRVTQVQYGNGSTINYTYDAAGNRLTQTVTVPNQPPVLGAIGDKSVDEGGTLSFSVTGSDPDDNPLTYSALGLPAGAAFDPTTPQFSWTPTFTQAGIYSGVIFTVTDGSLSASETITITVNNVNRPPVADAAGPYIVNEGGAVTLNGAGSDPDVGDALTYAWDLNGDGNFETPGQNVTFSATNINGPTSRTVTLRVTDSEGASATSSTTVNILNVPPTLTSVINNGPVNEGSPVMVTASAIDPGSDTLTYLFDFNNDGVFELSQASPAATHTFPDNRSFFVRVQVSDDDGALSNILTTTVVVNNVPPSITSVTNSGPVNEGSPATVNVAATDPGVNDTLTYYFDFNSDGVFEVIQSSSSASFTYSDNGSYTVQVQVRDKDGAASPIATTTILVNNVPPTVTALTAAPNPVNEGSSVSFSGAFTDPGTDTHTILWNFGDGVTATGTLTPTHTYADNGTYTVTLTVTDGDGGTGSSSLQVTVNNVPPAMTSLTATPNPASEGQAVAFAGTFTDPGTTDTHTLLWNFGDGSTATGTLTPSHTYADNGTYTVTLTVTDDDGGVGTKTATVIINNVAPTVTPRPSVTTDEGTLVDLTGTTFSDPGFADTHTATVNWGDGTSHAASLVVTNPGGPGSPRQGSVGATHIYADNGIYPVQVCVTDDDGGMGCGSFTATVNNVPPTISTFGSTTVDEGSPMTVSVSGSDTGAADVVTLSATGLPPGASFGQTPGNPATGTLAWTPAYTQSGSYSGLIITATDDDGASTTYALTLTVNEKGQPVIVVTDSNDHTVSLIDAATNQVVGVEVVGKKPVAGSFFDLFFAPSVPPARLYVAGRDTDKEIDDADEGSDTPDKGKGAVEVLVGPTGPSFANPYDFSFDTTIQVGNRPEGLAIKPDGSEIWMVNRNDDSISIIDRVTQKVVATIPLKITESSSGKGKAKETEVGRKPVTLTFSPDGQYVYVIGRNSNNLIVLNASTRAILAWIDVGNKPVAVVVSPDGARLYVADKNGGSISVVSLATPSSPVLLSQVAVGGKLEGLALLPNGSSLGSKLYVTDSETNSVIVQDIISGAPYLALRSTIPVGLAPMGLAVTKQGSFVNGGYLYVANRDDNTVSVIDTTNDTVIAIIPVGKGPTGIAAGIIPTAP